MYNCITPQVAYRHEPGRHSGKVVIYLEGGGACWSTETCAERCDPASPEAELCTADYDLKVSRIPSSYLDCLCLVVEARLGATGGGSLR